MQALRNTIIILLFSLSFSSCGFIHYLRTSLPKDESPTEIEKFFLENSIDYFDYSFMLIDSLADSLSSAKHALNPWKLERGTGASPVQLRVFDTHGDLINGYSQCFGDFKRLNIIKDTNLVFFNHLPINYELKLANEFILCDATEEQAATIMQGCKEHQFTIVFYWNIWSNYFSKIIFEKLEQFKMMFSNTDHDIQIILINTAI